MEAEESHVKHFHGLKDFQQSRHALPTSIQGLLLHTEQLTDSINVSFLNVNKQSITKTENLLTEKTPENTGEGGGNSGEKGFQELL